MEVCLWESFLHAQPLTLDNAFVLSRQSATVSDIISGIVWHPKCLLIFLKH